jgi:hypothetical protein
MTTSKPVSAITTVTSSSLNRTTNATTPAVLFTTALPFTVYLTVSSPSSSSTTPVVSDTTINNTTANTTMTPLFPGGAASPQAYAIIYGTVGSFVIVAVVALV